MHLVTSGDHRIRARYGWNVQLATEGTIVELAEGPVLG